MKNRELRCDAVMNAFAAGQNYWNQKRLFLFGLERLVHGRSWDLGSRSGFILQVHSAIVIGLGRFMITPHLKFELIMGKPMNRITQKLFCFLAFSTLPL